MLISAGCNQSPQAGESNYLRRGAGLMARHDYARAILEFKNAARIMPKDAEPQYQMGLAYLAARNVENALAVFRTALELNPNHAGAQLRFAEMMAGGGDRNAVEQAAERLESFLSSNPENLEAISTLALAESKLGLGEAAEKRLDAALQRFPAALEPAMTLARVKLTRRDFPGAAEVLRRTAGALPRSVPVAVALGEVYLLQQQPENAEREISRAVQLDPHNGPALLSMAALQMHRNRLEDADRTFQRLAALPDPEYQHLHAAFLYKRGLFDAALAEFEKLANQHPEDLSARHRLLSAYQAMNRVQASQDFLTGALRNNPRDMDALYQRALLFLRLRRLGDAASDLNNVVHVAPNSVSPHLALAAVYAEQNMPRLERQELDAALALDASLLPARLALARSQVKAHDGKSALHTLDQAPQPQQNILALLVVRVWALLANDELASARGLIDRGLKFGRLPELLLESAVLKMQQSDYAGATAAATEVLALDPKNIPAAQVLADCYAARKQDPHDGKSLLQLAAAHPNSAPLQNLLGEWYAGSGNPVEARRAFEAATKADPGFTTAGVAMAELDFRQGHKPEARLRLQQITAADPRNVRALLLLATIEDSSGERAAAIAGYRKALDLDENNIYAMNNLACDLAPENVDEALEIAQRALEAAPENPAVQDTLGWIYYRKGMYEVALPHLKAAVSHGATAPRQYHLGMNYLKLGDRASAQQLLALAFQANPDVARGGQ